jgi:hypothetical protein
VQGCLLYSVHRYCSLCWYDGMARLYWNGLLTGPFPYPGWYMSEYGAWVKWQWQGKPEGLGGKPVPVPLCPPQIPHGLPWERTRAAAVRRRQLTVCPVARPQRDYNLHRFIPRRPMELWARMMNTNKLSTFIWWIDFYSISLEYLIVLHWYFHNAFGCSFQECIRSY